MKICHRVFLSALGGCRSGVLHALVLVALVAGPTYAEAPYPHYGTRVVDGDISEWDLSQDYMYNLHVSGDPAKLLAAKAYLRYDCVTNTLYALVITEPGVVGLHDETTHGDIAAWIAINTAEDKVADEHSGNDGSPPDFEWYGPGFDGDPTHMQGFEASFIILPGSYEIIVHLQVLEIGGEQTAATTGFPLIGPPLVLECTVPVDHSTWGRIKVLYR